MRSERGAVLLSVLWIVLVLSMVSFALASTVRLEVASIDQSFDSERAFFMARGAAEIVYNSVAKNLPIPDNTPIRHEQNEYIFPFDSGEARVRLESSAGSIDLNKATDKVLASLFDSVQIDRETRNRLVDSILDWRDDDDIPHLYGAEITEYNNEAGQPRRPRNSNFQSVDELLMVKNMTPEIFFGSFVVESVTGQYRRIPGVRELLTVRSGSEKVDPNQASQDVLKALPGISASAAAHMVSERSEKPFTSSEDLLSRVSEISPSETLDYFNFEESHPSELVARATIASSGVSRTVRLLFKTEETVQFISYTPLRYKKTIGTRFDRWRFE